MVKFVTVTKAGGAMFDDENDVKVAVNADNINLCQPASEDEVGNTKIIFNDSTTMNVIETLEKLEELINT